MEGCFVSSSLLAMRQRTAVQLRVVWGMCEKQKLQLKQPRELSGLKEKTVNEGIPEIRQSTGRMKSLDKIYPIKPFVL